MVVKFAYMKRRVIFLVVIFAIFVFICALFKCLFLIVEPAYSPLKAIDFGNTLLHGLTMDMAVAGYFTIIPFIVLTVSVWRKPTWMARLLLWYFGLIGGFITSIFAIDAVLYPYWGFRLDMTPFFYFMSSPKAAFASAEWWMLFFGIGFTVFITFGIYKLFRSSILTFGYFLLPSAKSTARSLKRKLITTGALLLCGVLLFIAIRGGFTVSTMNPSRSYYTTDMKMNHAALNPVFTLLYSATHQGDFNKQFRYFKDDKAEEIVSDLYPTDRFDNEPPVMVDGKPDVYIIILESFSAHLMPSLGGEDIAMCLDSIASEGLLFTNAYASSFRTDRGLTAILSGYPAPPTTSLLKYVDKIDDIESIPRSMAKSGYRTEYYYGGDINFTNVNAYLRSAGVDKIVSDKDFPISERLSKWGVHDGPLFDKVITDIKADKSEKPVLRMIQTSSSHEPFDVPYARSGNKRVNAFMYADSQLGRFINALKTSGKWDNSLILITPDHYGCYPERTEGAVARHHIPIILTGGAIQQSNVMNLKELATLPISQNDIPATLLSLLGINGDDFPYSNNAFDPTRIPFAFVTEPSFASIITPEGATSISTESETIIESADANSIPAIKAMLQTLYTDLSRR